MKKRIQLFAFSGIALIFLSFFLNWYKHLPQATPISASVSGGYYEEPFWLELTSTQNGHIYYTTDGSRPTAKSELYTDGIYIYDRTPEPNKYNAVQNVVADWKDYTPDATLVMKGTVVRAVFINQWGKESEIFTQTYFINQEPPANGYTLSLIFEENDVFGADGIYVTGSDYDFWYLTGKHGSMPNSNFSKKELAPAIAEFMDSSGDVLLQPISMRVQGSSAVKVPKKRLALFADSLEDSRDVFSESLFSGVQTHSVMLKNVISDLVVADLVQDRAVSVQKNFPVRVFLNGEYWYDSHVLERFDSQYFQSYYGVDDIIFVKNGQQEETRNRSLCSYYDDFMDWVETTDFSQPENWEMLNEKMDVQSYIDFFCINHYLCNLDWSEKANCVLWCSTSDSGTGYEDMRWRWCIYDIDNLPDAAEYFGYDKIAQIDTFTARTPWINSQTNEQSLYLALRANPQFCQQFVLSFMDIVNNNFASPKIDAVLQKYQNVPPLGTSEEDWLLNFFQERTYYVAQHLAQEFQLTGSLESVHVSCENPKMGSVVVNTSCIDFSNGAWSGYYFSDYPITLTAIPEDGYEFLGWKGDRQDASETITVSLNGEVSLEAVFARTE